MKVLLIFFLFCSITSCGISRKYKNSELEKILEERYGQEFIVEKNKFYFELNSCQFIAVPVNNQEIKVHGSYKDNKSKVRDNYPQMVNNYQAEQVLSKQLEPFYDKFAVKANATYVGHLEQSSGFPDFLGVIRSDTLDAIAFFKIYLFDTINDNKKSFLKGITEAANFFNGNYYGTYTFRVSFWNPEFLKGKDLEKMNLGFNHNGEIYDDDRKFKIKYLEQELVFEFDASENPEITIDRIYKLLMPYNGGRNREYNRLE